MANLWHNAFWYFLVLVPSLMHALQIGAETEISFSLKVCYSKSVFIWSVPTQKHSLMWPVMAWYSCIWWKMGLLIEMLIMADTIHEYLAASLTNKNISTSCCILWCDWFSLPMWKREVDTMLFLPGGIMFRCWLHAHQHYVDCNQCTLHTNSNKWHTKTNLWSKTRNCFLWYNQ